MRQKITVLKVAGASGKKLQKWFSQIKKKGEANAKEYRGVQITSAEHKKLLNHLIKALRDHNSQPPIVFYTEYVDFWSSGCVFGDVFPKKQLNDFSFWFESTEIICYLLPDEKQLLKKLKKCSASRIASIPQETKWYWTILRLAVQAWEPLVPDATLIVIREILGGLVEDKEIESSLTAIPNWLPKASRS
jgi:hypothetical protein